ncbi:hypothetical protein ACFS07_31560 [Undibacterium arcticum]
MMLPLVQRFELYLNWMLMVASAAAPVRKKNDHPPFLVDQGVVQNVLCRDLLKSDKFVDLN